MSDDEMTPDKLRAAFEPFMMRVAAYGGSIPATVAASPVEAEAMLSAALEAARMWLLEHPADDATPVDADWLTAVGFNLEGGTGPFLEIKGETVEVTKGEVSWLVSQDSDVIQIADQPTRGCVRRLASALGITLKEAT